MVKSLQRQIQLKKTEDKFDRDLLQRKFELMDALREINKIEDDKTRIKAIGLETSLFELDKAEILNKKLKETVGTSENLREKFMEIGKSVEEGMVQGLTDAVMGTKSLSEAATGVLNNLKRQLIEVAAQRAVSGIGNFVGGLFGGGKKGGGIGGFLGGLFKRQAGGPVSRGQSYLVGERGPEVFTPSKSGRISPNSAMGGGTVNNITINVDAGGADTQGSSEQGGRELGELIASVVQSTIVQEQRSGGLLNP
jgi:hypothetical protein